jgi:transcription antitermination factor NusG
MGASTILTGGRRNDASWSATEDRREAAQIEPHWYAVYTRANHEKTVAEQLANRCIEHFLPLYSTVRRWKDRRVQLERPLFPGYVFVQLALREKLRVLEIPSVARLVGFEGHPTPLPELEITQIRRFLASGYLAEPHSYLRAGDRVRVVSGPLQGMEGILLKKRSTYRFVISIDLIMRSVSVQIDPRDLQPNHRTGARGVE